MIYIKFVWIFYVMNELIQDEIKYHKVDDLNTRLLLFSDLLFDKCKLLCISTSKRMLAHAFAWSKTIKNI